jgi:hypothetical protein
MKCRVFALRFGVLIQSRAGVLKSGEASFRYLEDPLASRILPLHEQKIKDGLT